MYATLVTRYHDYQSLTCLDITWLAWIKPGPHIPPTYQRRSRRLQLITFGDLSQWVPGASAMGRRHNQFAGNANGLAQFSAILPLKYGSNRLNEERCDRRWCSHKIFSSPTIAGLPTKLNSAQLHRQAGGQCLRHIMCRRWMFTYAAVVPGRTGSYVPGRSAAYENQALKRYERVWFVWK